jgi:hypothetical protein
MSKLSESIIINYCYKMMQLMHNIQFILVPQIQVKANDSTARKGKQIGKVINHYEIKIAQTQREIIVFLCVKLH